MVFVDININDCLYQSMAVTEYREGLVIRICGEAAMKEGEQNIYLIIQLFSIALKQKEAQSNKVLSKMGIMLMGKILKEYSLYLELM